MLKLLKLVFQHKFLTTIILLLIIGGGYFGYTKIFSSDGVIRYVTAKVQKGAIIVSISGSGQVSASNQMDIKPKVSGDIVLVAIKNNQEVKAGTLIAQIDTRDIQKTVRDAETNLKSAKLSLAKLKKSADALSIIQAENALTQAKDNLTKLKLSQEIEYQKVLEAKQKAEDDLKKAYEDGFNVMANAFLDLPGIMSGLDDMLFDNTFEKNQSNIDWYSNQTSSQNDEREKALRYRDDVNTAYNKALNVYNQNFNDYKSVSRTSDVQIIESLILETYETTKIIADAIKTSNNYIDFIQGVMEQHDFIIPSAVATHQSYLDSYTGKTNTHLLNILSIKRTIQTNKETITNSERDIIEINQNHPLELVAAEQSIKEKEESFAKLKAGTDTLDIQSQELIIKQKENALFDAKEKLADYFVRALFDGVIAGFDAKKGDSVSSATILGTLIAKQKLAEISLNEIDVAKIKVGQKATLTFDAVEGLSITGEVVEIDSVGTVSQGVVTYMVKIAFDTQDEKVKTAMSVSATIITEIKSDVLLVPNSAIKTQRDRNYVEIIGTEKTPQRQPIEVGIANDEFTEIISGLKKGDVIVTRTIQSTSAKTNQTQQQSSGLKIPGINTGTNSRQMRMR